MINCALVGYGYWGPNIARSVIRINDVNLKIICDSDDKKLNNAKTLYPHLQFSNNLSDILNDSEIDALIIATPAFTHLKIASQALAKDKHLLIEKPLTVSMVEAKKLQSLNKQYQKIIMVGHTFEYNPAVLKMKEYIQSKEFGQVYYMYSARLNLGQIRGDVNALWNLAPHDVSIFNFLLDGFPKRVISTGATFLQKNTEDVVFVTLEYPNNVYGHIHVSWLDPSKKREMTVVGSKQMLVFDDIDNEMPLKIYDKRADTGDVAKGIPGEYKFKLHSGDIFIPQVEAKEPLLEELKHFFDCIEHNKQPKTDIENGLQVVKVLEACQQSLKKKNIWVKI